MSELARIECTVSDDEAGLFNTRKVAGLDTVQRAACGGRLGRLGFVIGRAALSLSADLMIFSCPANAPGLAVKLAAG